MLRFILTRVSLVVPTFIGITLLVFVLVRLIPGDPIETMAGERGIDPARHEQLRKEYGFDRPVLVQYGYYLARLAHGDLGRSVVTHEPVRFEDGTKVTRKTYAGGKNGAEVVLIEIEGGGHTWPGGPPSSWTMASRPARPPVPRARWRGRSARPWWCSRSRWHHPRRTGRYAAMPTR